MLRRLRELLRREPEPPGEPRCWGFGSESDQDRQFRELAELEWQARQEATVRR